MLSFVQQTETKFTTNSTEQIACSSKNQRRKLEREQSRNWFGFSHREYEGTLYRIANNGRKRYEDTIAKRMEAKKAERMAKKQTNELPTPITTAMKPTISADVVVVNRYANTPVVYKMSHGKLIVLAFLDGDNPKHSTVYNIKDGVATFCKKGSRAQKYTDEEFAKYGWKTSTLGDDDFAPILALLMEAETEDESNATAAA